jgi:peptidyl-prolyl cis-trans isomerase SurA
MYQAARKQAPATRPASDFMNLRLLRTSGALAVPLVFGAALLLAPSLALGQANEPESPYGGTTVEDIIARVNDQIITKSDYDRAESELDQQGRDHGLSMQEMAAERRDLLRNLIDQQLWLSKGKELDITGETELVKRLDEIRKQYNLDSLEDLEKAAKEQGVSFEDFKANIRNQIITQEVMRQEVGEHIQMTPGEVQRYYEQHKQDYAQPESERLSEILISTGTDDPAKLAAAKAKADDIEARLHSGGDFAQLARSFSEGTTAASGGDLGQYKRGQLPKVLEDKTFSLNSGQYTDPILTRQGYIILKVVQHTAGGPRPYKDAEEDVEQAYYMSLMDPAIRDYLNQMRDQAFIQIKQGYVDAGATPSELHSSISFSAYQPPAPKKKAKVERTRFRESTHTFRDKSGAAVTPAKSAGEAQASAPPATPAPTQAAATSKKKGNKKEEASTEKPGKKEKIRFGQAPRETLPSAKTNSATEDAGAVSPSNQETASNADQPANPLEPTTPTVKTRFSARARAAKPAKTNANGGSAGSTGPAPPDAGEVADQQTQSSPLGLSGDTSGKKKKKTSTVTGDKTRLADKKKSEDESQPKPVQQPTPIPPVPGAPAPADHPDQPQPQQPAPQ